MVKKDIYQEITNQIILDLEKGLPVWEKPWEKEFTGFPVNVSSNSFYSGINTVILWLRQSQIGSDSSQWLTFRQAHNLGGRIKKGAKATCVVFYKKITVEDEETEEERTIPMLKTYPVFNLSQCEGLDHLKKAPVKKDSTFQDKKQVEELIKASKAQIIMATIDRACYVSKEDKILMPKKFQFKTQEGFYSTMFHELSHWTGHESRLNRKVGNKFGSRAYAFEELVAEISASFLCCHLGFRYSTQHSAYVKTWIEVLKGDKTAVFRASALAQKATEFILNLKEGVL